MWPFFLAALGVVVADQLTKWWISSSLLEGQSLFEAGIFKIARFSPNTGAAFGLFQDQSFALAIVAIFGGVFLLVYAFAIRRRFSPLDNLLGWSALGLILGGIAGNLIDRLRFGAVTDFISIGWWPAFNIADSAVVVGVILIAYSLLFLARKHGQGI
jgi:signal peptidase II